MRMDRAVGAPATRSFSTFSCRSAQKTIHTSKKSAFRTCAPPGLLLVDAPPGSWDLNS